MKLNLKQVCLNVYKQLPENITDSSVTLNLEKGDFLYHRGEKPNGFYFIKSGLMAITDISPNGNESLLRVYHASSLALEDSTVIRLPFTSVEQLQNEYAGVFLHITQMLARDLRMAEERFNDLTGKRVMSRIIDSLLFLQRRKPDYQWTRREIGEFCGAKTETVTRSFGKLEGLGLLQKNNREIIVPDPQKLLDYKHEFDLEA
jgi:CRP-like cAMP-binding protein